MEEHFNLSRYKELLKLEESGKISFLDENYLELLSYNASVAQQIYYNRKKDYFLLIHEYLSQVIPPYEFRSKFLVNFDINLEEKTNRFNANFRIFQRNPDEPSENLDLTASIPEDRVLAKLYQIKPFGVNVPKEVDLKRAKNLPTRPRLEYLRDKTSVKTIQETYIQFANHLKDEKTEVFLGKFGEEFENNDTYDGFYAYNNITRNMMFFQEDSKKVGGYSLHSYMFLNRDKAKQLEENH